MNENIFRKQSIDRISSPEQLNDYIKVSNPSIWIILTAVIVLLAAVLVWSIGCLSGNGISLCCGFIMSEAHGRWPG
jgi:hypothetical protein